MPVERNTETSPWPIVRSPCRCSNIPSSSSSVPILCLSLIASACIPLSPEVLPKCGGGWTIHLINPPLKFPKFRQYACLHNVDRSHIAAIKEHMYPLVDLISQCQIWRGSSPQKPYHTDAWSGQYSKAMLPLLGLADRQFLDYPPQSVRFFLYCGRDPRSWWPRGPVGTGSPWLLPWRSGPVPWRWLLVSISRIVARSLGRTMMGKWVGGVVLWGR